MIPTTELFSPTRHRRSSLTPEEHEKMVALVAAERIERFERCYDAFDTEEESSSEERDDLRSCRCPLELDWNQIEITHVIGEGSFSVVRRAHLKNEDKTYALKSLRSDVLKDKKAFGNGAIDLALEAKILSRVSHPNIVALIGIKSGTLSEALSVKDGGFFILEEYLTETLDHRIATWKEEERGTWKPFQKKTDAKLLHRLESAALGVVCAMEYLHEQDIIFRDLKPANVGFAEDGSVRLFDFGLAREITGYASDKSEAAEKAGAVQQRRLTGLCGTPRYMAPEVGKHHSQYGLPADIYSFAVLLWELVTLKKPYQDVKTLMMFHQDVFSLGRRPPLASIRSKPLKELIARAWNQKSEERPCFTEIREMLEEEINSMKQTVQSIPSTRNRSRTNSVATLQKSHSQSFAGRLASQTPLRRAKSEGRSMTSDPEKESVELRW